MPFKQVDYFKCHTLDCSNQIPVGYWCEECKTHEIGDPHFIMLTPTKRYRCTLCDKKTKIKALCGCEPFHCTNCAYACPKLTPEISVSVHANSYPIKVNIL